MKRKFFFEMLTNSRQSELQQIKGKIETQEGRLNTYQDQLASAITNSSSAEIRADLKALLTSAKDELAALREEKKRLEGTLDGVGCMLF
jgi:phage shock protein A